ncbi:Uncharacterised protein [Mycobacteroides abscessus subsp. massiliense]|nr:hypothetical protein BAB75_10175 [Mycobacteroides immunogenum]RIU10841.1 hypothetical protein D2F01_16200 [Mycobacteroides abscessus]CPV42565.1 Uncharacterised protein [Mycobacteroides abscessus]SLC99239.1 Uncharacterised protein [Mycobacteroides abscessus subsp. massiliense]SLH78338.1 Uncharacterised protein [Mycobacteroides abscessus subsp. massiliense]
MDRIAADRNRFYGALAARDVRRITAWAHSIGLDEETLERVVTTLEQLEMRVWILAFEDPDSSSGWLDQQDTYSDGHPVTSSVNWGSGHATLVHSREAGHQAVNHPGELADERWPNSSEAS